MPAVERFYAEMQPAFQRSIARLHSLKTSIISGVPYHLMTIACAAQAEKLMGSRVGESKWLQRSGGQYTARRNKV